MAILITVFQCDNCAAIAGLKSDADWQQFEKHWWEGFYFQFCPDCAEKPETKERRLKDTQLIADLTKLREKEDVINAEFIN